MPEPIPPITAVAHTPGGVALVLCPLPGDAAPAEFAFGLQRLRECFGADARFIDPGPGHGDPAAEDGRGVAPLLAGLPDSARVAWLPDAQRMVMPVVLERLARVLDADASITAALAHDQRFAPQPPPDYCTERGLERYLARLGDETPAIAAYTGQAAPGLTLTTAGALRHGTVWSRACWVANACIHDFADYQQAKRDEVIALVPPQAQRILDVGGGEGRFLERLRQVRAPEQLIETHLAEESPAACAAARERVNRVWPGDFGTVPIAGPFDCICFLEALEHTSDPLRWLLRARSLLAPGGAVVASVPNVGHWSVIADLLEGRWDWSPVGVHCITHLRFFTEHSLRALFARAGLQVARIDALRIPCPPALASAWTSAAAAGAWPRLSPDPASWDAYAFLVQAFAPAELPPAQGKGGDPTRAGA